MEAKRFVRRFAFPAPAAAGRHSRAPRPQAQFERRTADAAVRVPAVTSRYAPLWTGLTVVAVGLAIVGLFLWPFLFESAAVLMLLIAAKSTANQRQIGRASCRER